MNRARERVELNMEELERLLERAKKTPLNEPDYQTLKAAVETLGYLTRLLEDRKTTIERLRQILFGASTEKTRNVLKSDPTHKTEDQKKTDTSLIELGREKSEKKTKGHGRNGAEAYPGATKIEVRHNSLKSGDRCPECRKGKVYNSTQPGLLVRIVGQAPLAATVYQLEKLRCNLCGEVFTADAPDGVGPEKYDASSGSMIALLKYGSGLPFYRLEGLQGNLGIPLPASTQWGIVLAVAAEIKAAYEELIRQAAQGEVLHNDDTAMRILALMRQSPENAELAEEFDDSEPAQERSGIFTSGIVSTREGRKIALFFTGHKHAGENLTDLLKKRAKELGPPIQMCDALSRNLPKDLEVIVANCLAHGRRKFIDQVRNFPESCRYVLETLREVYQTDALAKEKGMSPDERLALHQAQSAPLMAEFEKWMNEQIEERKVEPNSGLCKSISYMNHHFHKLTLFLRVPGAPLDNNICERALKKAILHRKNALFYKTQNGAHVGDLFMSLIHTCQLAGISAFDYLTELQIHAAELSRNPQEWMPWNYRDTLQRQNFAPSSDI
ncbi:MAG: IS66 family transposase [Deltaproteobacteria bacterium]|nr:IS66 family transposase [Deltaproteobacteria bacterium]